MSSGDLMKNRKVHHHFTVEPEDGVDNKVVHKAIMRCLDNYDVSAELVNDSSYVLAFLWHPELVRAWATYSVRGKFFGADAHQEVLNARKGIRRLSRGKIKFDVWWPV